MSDATLTIGGEAVHGAAGTYPVFNPARPAEVVLEAPHASPEQVDQAVRAAKEAAHAWGALPFEERAERVCRAAELAAEQADRAGLATLLTRENGKVLGEAQFELATIAAVVQMVRDLAATALEPRRLEGGSFVSFEPFGVVAALLPFNWPVSVLVSKLAPALLAGNTIVVKPPPTCPGACLVTARALASALPAGVVNAVNGPGTETGEQLTGHRSVDLVSLTGGVATGKAVMRTASDRLAPVLLELGGNDAAIVAPDVQPSDALATALLEAATLTSGQVCTALKRLYVHQRALPAMVDALVEAAAATVTGDGLAPDTTLGPLHTERAARFAEGLLAEAASEAAKVHRPGKVRASDAGSSGYFVPPAIVEAVPPASRIVTAEQFAPVLPVLPYRDVDAAVDAANSTSYGLGASIWTADDDLAFSVASRLQAGTVFRNAHGPAALDPRLPFGGWKRSGIGREYGPDGVLAYCQSRAVLGSRPLPTA